MELPGHVDWRLRNEFHSHLVPREKYEAGNAEIDALYATADQPHQLALMSASDFSDIDIFYMTRFQKERYAEGTKANYLRVDSKFLKNDKYRQRQRHASAARAWVNWMPSWTQRRAPPISRQASYGVPIRMALIAAVLELDAQNRVDKFPRGFRPPPFPVEARPQVRCTNPNCITHDPHDGDNTGSKFYVIASDRLRCYYCETDVEAVADKAKSKNTAQNARRITGI